MKPPSPNDDGYDDMVYVLSVIFRHRLNYGHRKDFRGYHYWECPPTTNSDRIPIDLCVALGYIIRKPTWNGLGYLRFTFKGLWICHVLISTKQMIPNHLDSDNSSSWRKHLRYPKERF